MEKVNQRKVIITTLSKILLMIMVFFIINNWPHIKQSFNGEIPAFSIWLDHSFTPSNLVLIAVLSVIFYMNSLKTEKERVAWENSEVKE